jgi:hypothetical protein
MSDATLERDIRTIASSHLVQAQWEDRRVDLGSWCHVATDTNPPPVLANGTQVQ